VYTTVPRKSTDRRSTPRAAKPGLRERILDVARELFAEEGYDSVSMRRIGAEAGCSAMAMYRYFSCKEELLLCICEETFARLAHSRDLATNRCATPLERLRAAIRNFVRFGIEHPNHYKLAFMMDMPDGPMAARRAAISADGLSGIRDLVRDCTAGRKLRVDVELTVELIHVASRGLVAACIVKPPSVVLSERLLAHLVRTLTQELE